MNMLQTSSVKNFFSEDKLLALLAVAGFASVILTFFSFNQSATSGNTDIWLWGSAISMILLIGLLARRIYKFISLQRKTVANSKLHLKLSALFLVTSLTPAIFIAIFSMLFFHYGVQTWFSNQIKTAVTESQVIAEAYLEEHQNAIRADLLAMANDLNTQSDLVFLNRDVLTRLVNTQTFIRNLSEAIIFTRDGRVLARSSLNFTLEPENIPDYIMERVAQGVDEVIIFSGDEDDRVRAIVPLQSSLNTFLAVGRLVDPTVLARVEGTRDAVAKYRELESQYSGLRQTLTLSYAALALFLTGMAVWVGLSLASYLIKPVTNLLKASEKIRAGDLNTHVDENTGFDEFNILATSFNRMIGQIKKQRTELLNANREMDERRQYTEAVLRDVTSGVISVDDDGVVTLANRAAARLLGFTNERVLGTRISAIMPEIIPLIDDKTLWVGNTLDTNIPYKTQKGERLDLIIKIVSENDDVENENIGGFIITFDDISVLKSAQRKAAWSDVARRIAHEIKNPLTPIQLSAERINRRFAEFIPEDHRDVFEKCIQTIGKHVEDIGRMVAEFSSFARMPEAIIKPENINVILSEVLVMQGEANHEVAFNKLGGLKGKSKFLVNCDAQQMRQVITNIIQNAVESLQDNKADKILNIWACARKGRTFLVFQDNGPGFPESVELSTLTDPYVTHKPKGTGLGLAIVKKIMDDHGGQLILGSKKWMATELEDFMAEDKAGATVALSFPNTDNELSN